MLDFKDYRAMDATALAAGVARGDFSPAELLETAIARAEAVNPALNAIVQPQYGRARDDARNGLARGPLYGVPFLLKDLGAWQEGQPATGGSRLFADFQPDHHATYTARCLAAGLNVIGRTNTPEMGLNASTEPMLFGPCRNPWNLDRSTGGSSGGSAAAVAAGILPMAHATDGGGSIRIPAANCGLFGLKPTRARNPSGPDVGEGWSGMATAHVVSRSVRDSALMLDCTHGPAPGDPYNAPPVAGAYVDEVGRDPGRLRIALMTTGFDGLDLSPACAAAARDTGQLCETLGHDVEEAAPPLDMTAARQAFRVIVAGNVWTAISARAAALGRQPSGQDVEPVTWLWGQEGRGYSAADYAAAVLAMHRLGRQLADFFQRYDVILSSTLQTPPLPLGALDMRGGDLDVFLNEQLLPAIPITPVYNMTGCPAMTLPLAWSEEGMPIGVHVGASFGAEDLLFRLAGQLEQARPWFDRVPDLS